MKFFREPLVHFLIIGAALFAVYAYWGQQDTEEQGRTINISAGEINWLTDIWKKRWMRQPVPERNGSVSRGGCHGP
ncbi:MAG: hypothetical protein JRF04_06740 [Deltaproteobacteria bacterium]|nr:hypothetical protein [Deltaproteobacteria bacterium]